jgi:thiol-disulfide isomerase/thioredoxin
MAKKFVLKKVPQKKGSGSMMTYLYVAIGVMLVAFAVYYGMKLWKSKEHFEEAAPESKVTLIYSESCGHCRNFLPVFEEICGKKDELFPKLKLTCSKFTSGDAGAAAYSSKVSGVPAIFITAPDGNETHLVGYRTKEVFIKDIENAITSKSA